MADTGSSSRHSTASAPCAGAGSISAGSRISVASCARPRRASPARASTTASSSPPETLRSRVSTLPRIGTVSIGRPSAASCAMRRTAPVPTRAPGGSCARVRPSRATSASRGSSRGGTAAMTSPSAGAVGRSLYEWTARSISLASKASRSAETNTPTPSWATGAVDRSPLVVIRTSSTGSPVRSSIACATRPACASASALPLVPSLIARPRGSR